MAGKLIAAIVVVAITTLSFPGSARGDDWQKLGLLRVRDMTPFGLARLDFLPPHALAAPAGTWAVELTYSHQNTWALSDNVREYLKARSADRRELTPADVEAILALPGDAYLVDGEYGLIDLTLHYKASSHLGVYVTIPYFRFDGGDLDSAIESFHDRFGFSDTGRSRVAHNRWHAIAKLQNTVQVLSEAPRNDFGDPVVGVRYALEQHPAAWNVIVEGAAKIPRSGARLMISTGEADLGAQVSLQRFFQRNALYATLSGVYFNSPDSGLAHDQWIPTAILGWETRLSEYTGLVLQLYGSRSTVQETNLAELSADKFQLTLGLQWALGGKVLRFGVTENLSNFNNTPDLGLSVSFARIFRAIDQR